MSVPLNLISAVPVDQIDNRRMAQFTEQTANFANALIAAGVLIQSGSNEWSIDPNSLPPSGVVAGVYTNPTITVNTQGLLTQAADGTAVAFVQENGAALTQRDTINFVTGLVATDDATRTNVNLADTAVSPATYTNATVTVDQQGRITSAANGSASGISPLTTKGDIWGFSTVDARFPLAVGDAAIIIQDAAATFGFKWVAVGTDVTISTAGAVTIANDAVTYAKMQNASAGNVFLGRADSSSGDYSEVAIGASQLAGRGSSGNLAAITVGAGLTISSTTLAATGGGIGGGPLIVVKPSDESVTLDTTVNPDTHLTFAIGANETWIVEFTLFIVSPTNGDFKCAISTPTGASGFAAGIGVISTGTTSGDVIMSAKANVTTTGDFGCAGSGAGIFNIVKFVATVINGANAGSVTFNWAQLSSSSTSNTTVKAGSFLVAHRVA